MSDEIDIFDIDLGGNTAKKKKDQLAAKQSEDPIEPVNDFIDPAILLSQEEAPLKKFFVHCFVNYQEPETLELEIEHKTHAGISTEEAKAILLRQNPHLQNVRHLFFINYIQEIFTQQG